MAKNTCKDCGRRIDRRAKRCNSCAARALWQDPEFRHKHSEAMRDPEIIRKMSEAVKAAHARGIFDDPEYRRKVSEAMKAAWARGDFDDPEWRRKNSEATRRQWASGVMGPDVRRKMSEAQKALWQDPEYHRKMSEAQKALWRGAERRHKWSEASKALWQDPEFRRSLSGENSPHWRGGMSFDPYPPAFNEALRRAIRKRDNHTCAISGEPGRDIHHINYCKTDNRPENLITLCHSCHSKTGANREHWEGLLSPIAMERSQDEFTTIHRERAT